MQADGNGPLAAVFAAPGKYIQGRGAVLRLGRFSGSSGQRNL